MKGDKMFADDLIVSSSGYSDKIITKQKLLKIQEIYNFCKNAQQNSKVRDIANYKFAQIVEEAKTLIKNFADGCINLDIDAIELMKKYIDEFGKEYHCQDSKMIYDFTNDAIKAKALLNQMAYRQASAKHKYNSVQNVHYNLDALMKGTADEYQIKENFNKPSYASLQSVSLVHHDTQTTQEDVIKIQENKPVYTKPEINIIKHEAKFSNVLNVKQEPVSHLVLTQGNTKQNSASRTKNKSKKSFFSIIKDFCSEKIHIMHKNIKRYGVAAVALFSTTSAYNGYPMNRPTSLDKNSFETTLNTKPASLLDVMPKSTFDASKFLTDDNKVSSESSFDASSFNQFSSLALNNVEKLENAYVDSLTNSQNILTLADLEGIGYTLTSDDLKAMKPSSNAQALADAAEKVAQNMNCGGLCFRGVKRAFNQTGMGQMSGGSAYMAKDQLDENPNFVKVSTDIQNNDVAPDGSVVVFGKSALHPHGHIGVLKGGKDCSSKVRNAMTSVGSYGGVNMYLPADIKVPETVINNLKQISVLNLNVEQEKNNINTPSPFVLVLRQAQVNG